MFPVILLIVRVCVCVCETDLLSPPPNIYASVKGGALVVSWGLPRTREVVNPYCFEYQLDKGDQVQYL